MHIIFITLLREHLVSQPPPPPFGGIRVAHFLCILCCVFCFACHRPVTCVVLFVLLVIVL